MVNSLALSCVNSAVYSLLYLLLLLYSLNCTLEVTFNGLVIRMLSSMGGS